MRVEKILLTFMFCSLPSLVCAQAGAASTTEEARLTNEEICKRDGYTLLKDIKNISYDTDESRFRTVRLDLSDGKGSQDDKFVAIVLHNLAENTADREKNRIQATAKNIGRQIRDNSSTDKSIVDVGTLVEGSDDLYEYTFSTDMKVWTVDGRVNKSMVWLKIVSKEYVEEELRQKGIAEERRKTKIDSIKRAADSGNLDAILDYARRLANNDEVKGSLVAASIYYEKAYKMGSQEARKWLGEYNYELCRGYNAADFTRFSMSNFEFSQHKLYNLIEAAKYGHVQAQYELGMAYESQRTPFKEMKFPEATRNWLSKAAANGHYKAAYELAYTCFGTEHFTEGVVRYLKDAADKGNIGACRLMGYCYEKGVVVEKDSKMMIKYTRTAADGGDYDAMCNLAVYYALGQGIEKNTREAMSLLRKVGNGSYHRRATMLINSLQANYLHELESDWRDSQREYKLRGY